uniref:Uncharacterized protein n=1 Tax=Rhizophora mucronata TaxID=61149 RepID=A0A2P2MXE7_RHIMU
MHQCKERARALGTIAYKRFMSGKIHKSSSQIQAMIQ